MALPDLIGRVLVFEFTGPAIRNPQFEDLVGRYLRCAVKRGRKLWQMRKSDFHSFSSESKRTSQPFSGLVFH